MARQYAINGLFGLKGDPVTLVNGSQVAPGNPLPAGTTNFTLVYYYDPTPADVAAGAPPGVRINVTIQDVPISASNATVRNAIMQARASRRDSALWPVQDSAGNWTDYEESFIWQ